MNLSGFVSIALEGYAKDGPQAIIAESCKVNTCYDLIVYHMTSLQYSVRANKTFVLRFIE